MEESKDGDDDEDWTPNSFGTIFNWAHSDNLGAIGVLYTLLAVILANGRVVSDCKLLKICGNFK
jgi:melanoma-associated antigen